MESTADGVGPVRSLTRSGDGSGLDGSLVAQLLALGWTPPPDFDPEGGRLQSQLQSLDGAVSQRSYAEDLAVARVRARHAADNQELIQRAVAARKHSAKVAADSRLQQARATATARVTSEATTAEPERPSTRAELETEVDQLLRALASRPSIEHAVGIVMATLRCDPMEAFEVLTAISQNTNTKLREIARDLVEQVGTGALSPATLSNRLQNGMSGRRG